MYLKIKTIAEDFYSGSIDSLILPLIDGQSGFLAGHCNMTSLLGHGLLSYRIKDVLYYFLIHKGIAQVENNQITVLAEEVIRKEELSKESIEEELKQTKKELHNADFSRFSREMLEEIIIKSHTQLTVLKRGF